MKNFFIKLSDNKFMANYFEPLGLVLIILGMLVNIMKTDSYSVSLIDFVFKSKGSVSYNLCNRQTAIGYIIVVCIIAMICSVLPKIREVRHIISMFAALYTLLDVQVVCSVLSGRAVLGVSVTPWFYVYSALCVIVIVACLIVICGNNIKRAKDVEKLAQNLKTKFK